MPPTSLPSQAHSAAHMYDSRAAHYDASWHPAFAAHLVSLAALSPGNSVLDVACGTGLTTLAAASAVGPAGQVVGVDISSGMLAQLRSKILAAELSNVQVYQHDIAQLRSLDALQGRRFDAVTCASALVLLDDPAAAVAAWAAFLAPGGRLVLDATHPHSLVPGIVIERTAKRVGGHVPWNRDWCRSQEALTEVLERDGSLRVESVVEVQQTGLGTRFMAVGLADEKFEELVRGPATEWLQWLVAEKGEGKREEAREVFREEWENMGEDGVVKDVDLVWVAIATKRRD